VAAGAARAEAPGSRSRVEVAREACPVRRPCNRRVAAIRRRISGTWTRRHERPDEGGTQETGRLACPPGARPSGCPSWCQTPRYPPVTGHVPGGPPDSPDSGGFDRSEARPRGARHLVTVRTAAARCQTPRDQTPRDHPKVPDTFVTVAPRRR